MADFEKVIKGLEAHARCDEPCVSDDGITCPYYRRGPDMPCVSLLCYDALEVIQTQQGNIKSYQRTIDRMNKVLMIRKEKS